MLWRPRPRRTALSTALLSALLLLALNALLMLPATGFQSVPENKYYINLGFWEIQMGGCSFRGNTNGGTGSALTRLGSCSGEEVPLGVEGKSGDSGRLDFRDLYIHSLPSDAFRGMSKLK
jgi:hypothetical protein